MSLKARGLQKKEMTATFLRMVLKKLTGKLVLDYVKLLNKFNNSFLRIKLLQKCFLNDIIPDFLRLSVFFWINCCRDFN